MGPVVSDSLPMGELGRALTTALIITGISSVVSGRVLGHFSCSVLLISSACLFLDKHIAIQRHEARMPPPQRT